MILAADIAPTTTHVALFDDGGYQVLCIEAFRTREYASVVVLLARFLELVPGARVVSACIGVSFDAPVYAHELVEVFEIPSVVVVDGLEANVCRLRDLARIAAERLPRSLAA